MESVGKAKMEGQALAKEPGARTRLQPSLETGASLRKGQTPGHWNGLGGTAVSEWVHGGTDPTPLGTRLQLGAE